MIDSPFPIPDSSPIHVVAAVIRDARGRVLLARRTEGRDLAGAWEFPGGKVDPGESPLQALARELKEELGIQIGPATPRIAVPQRYAHKRIVLDVYDLQTYRGSPKGLEQQALVWSPVEKLHTYPMPPADRPVVAALQQPAVFAITPAIERIDQVISALQRCHALGVTRLQLRAPTLQSEDFEALAVAALEASHRHGVQLVLNAGVGVARRLSADLHLNSRRMLALSERPVPADRLFGVSCHDEAELRHAERIGADYAFLGPVQATATHPEAIHLGWEGFAALREQVSLPIYALGGLSAADVESARRHGAQGVAGIRAFA